MDFGLHSVPTIVLDGLQVNYTVKHSSKRTRVSLVVVDGSVEVRMPQSLPEDYAQTYLKEKKDWILHHVRKQLDRPKPLETSFSEGDVLLLFGEKYRLSVNIGQKTTIRSADGTIIMTAHPRATPKFLLKQLKVFYSKELMSYISQRVHYFVTKGLDAPKTVEVREYRRKWAACLSDNTLRFNWKLALAPREVIDLVIVHELVHLRIRNHGKLFWATVSNYIPNRKELNEWLKNNSTALNIIVRTRSIP